MKKLATLGVILGLILLTSMIGSAFATVAQPNPPGQGVGQANRMQIVLENGGGGPSTLDPSIIYDTASAEVTNNIYDNLIQFDGEHMGSYLGILAYANYTLTQLGTGITDPDTGLTWYYRYDFQLKNWANMTFAPPYNNYTLTAGDIKYSLERTMVLDPPGGPQWMLTEPLLNDAGGAADLLLSHSVATVGKMIDHSIDITSEPGHIWFNIAYNSTYPPWPQILCQSWTCVMSKQFINNQIIGEEGIQDWNGVWGDYTPWKTIHDIGWGSDYTGPLDHVVHAIHMACGSGPFSLTTWDTSAGYWLITRNPGYWQGWPAPWPYMAAAGPAGYVNTVKEYFSILDTSIRVNDLISGATDMSAIPRAHIGDLYKSPIAPYGPPGNYPDDGIRCVADLPTLQCEVLAFTFNISTATIYGHVHGAGDWSDASGIPSDFFGNANWGLDIRKAFAYVINYANYLQVGWLGEAQVGDLNPSLPPTYTVFVPTLPWIDPIASGYTYSLASAWTELQAAHAAGMPYTWTCPAIYSSPASGPRWDIVQNELPSGFAAINAAHGTNMIVTPYMVSWGTLLGTAAVHQASCYAIGWLADYPDPHDFAEPFLQSAGTYSVWDRYSNSTMDALVAKGIKTANGPARTAVYTEMQIASLQDLPVVPLALPLGRHFERDWLVGWYYNPIYSGIFGYNLWKWWYLPQVASNGGNPPVTPYSDQLGADVNYDGIVNMRDVGTVARSFGAVAGPPPDTTWVFRCDTNLDRLINMKDVGYVARNYGPTISDMWTATP